VEKIDAEEVGLALREKMEEMKVEIEEHLRKEKEMEVLH
jgi:hypothetical protein